MSLKKIAKKIGSGTLSVAKTILIELYEACDNASFGRPGPRYYSASVARAIEGDEERFRKINAKRAAIRRLRQKRWLVARANGREVMHSLTKDGKIAALQTIMEITERRLPKGEYCLVSFDIPESARKARAQFRILLKRCHFVLDHQSAWLTDHDVRVEIQEVVKLLKIQRWVHIFHAKEI